MKYIAKYLLLGDSKVRVIVVWMGARVNDAIHVQVQIVKLGDLMLFDYFRSGLSRVLEVILKEGKNKNSIGDSQLQFESIFFQKYTYMSQKFNLVKTT